VVTRRLGLVFPDAFTTSIPRRAALSKSLVFSEILGPQYGRYWPIASDIALEPNVGF
jgi:hypothetical protein